MSLFVAYLTGQRSLRDLQALSYDVWASIEQAVITVDCGGVVTSANPACLSLLGVGAGSTERKLGELASISPLAELSRQVLRTERAVSDRGVKITRGGRTTRLRVNCQLLQDSEGRTQGTVLHVQDVTEQSLLEERMRRMERYSGLGAVAAGLHHEIRNPLGALSLHAQLLEERLEGDLNARAAEHLQVLKTEIARIGGVLESFRDFASVTALNRRPTDIGPLLERTIRLIRPQAERRGVRLTPALTGATGVVGNVDAARLEQVLLNLLLNAVEAMRDGGDLTVQVFADDEQVRIDVADTGPGIPETIRSRVFDPYFTTKTEGSGMGLALCQKIVQQHGGNLDFDTSPGGTVFHLSLPLTATD